MDNKQNQQIEDKTAGMVTGKSQRSAFDFFEKIETNFLEKYLIYLIKDEIGANYFEYNAHDHQLVSQTFRALNDFKMNEFLSALENHLKQFESTPQSNKKKEPCIIKIYENQLALQDDTVKEEEITYVYNKIKITNSKLKDLSQDLIKRIQREKDFKNYNYDTLNLLVFYTGDINFDFTNDKMFKSGQAQINGKTYKLKVITSYISKVALFNHFSKSNNLNIEQVDDKIITLFELKRMSFKKRQQAQLRTQNEEKKKEEKKKKLQRESNSIFNLDNTNSTANLQQKLISESDIIQSHFLQLSEQSPQLQTQEEQTLQKSYQLNENNIKTNKENNNNSQKKQQFFHQSDQKLSSSINNNNSNNNNNYINNNNNKKNNNIIKNKQNYSDRFIEISIFLGLTAGVPLLMKKLFFNQINNIC